MAGMRRDHSASRRWCRSGGRARDAAGPRGAAKPAFDEEGPGKADQEGRPGRSRRGPARPALPEDRGRSEAPGRRSESRFQPEAGRRVSPGSGIRFRASRGGPLDAGGPAGGPDSEAGFPGVGESGDTDGRGSSAAGRGQPGPARSSSARRPGRRLPRGARDGSETGAGSTGREAGRSAGSGAASERRHTEALHRIPRGARGVPTTIPTRCARGSCSFRSSDSFSRGGCN